MMILSINLIKEKNSFKLMFNPQQRPLEIETKEFIRNLNCKPDYSNSDKAIKILNLIEKCRKIIKMKIAVVGAGIFGVTAAYTLAKNHSVDLFEKNNDIMMESSDVNQCRIHRGYHYPRSPDTVKKCFNC